MQIWNSQAHAGVLHLLIILGPVAVVAVVPAAMATATAGSITQVPAAAGVAAAPDCRVAGQSGAAVPKAASATGAVRTTIGVARAMHVPRKGQIVAVMVMFQSRRYEIWRTTEVAPNGRHGRHRGGPTGCG